MIFKDTIVALATPNGIGAIHIIRVSGKDTYEIVDKILEKKMEKKSYHIEYNKVIKDRFIIDEVLLMKFVAPNSFTGEDSIEINCHGGIYIAHKIINLLIEKGCRTAKNGEFSQRAVMNSKMNLFKAEAINNLINASNHNSVLLSNKYFSKKSISFIEEIRNNILNIIGNLEVNIDYPEYDQEEIMTKKEIITSTKKTLLDLEKLFLDSKKIQPINEGLKIVLTGKPNVGKSSILNCLLSKDKAIVSDIAGTTRDIVEGELLIDGIKIKFMDTAGIRKAKNLIEKIGIDKSIKAIEEANLIINVFDNVRDLKEYYKINGRKRNVILVLNKIDKFNSNFELEKLVKISAKNKQINQLIESISYFINKNLQDFKIENNYLISERQIQILSSIIEEMKEIIAILKINENPVDLIAMNLHKCLKLISEILGDYNDDIVLDSIFAKFCLGK